jgi:hypothetical protein
MTPWSAAYHIAVGGGQLNFIATTTLRMYAQPPFYNMMNNQDLFAEILLQPLTCLNVRTDLHYLRPTEGADLVYFGGGATKKDFFGFGGVKPFLSWKSPRLVG